MMTPSFDVPFNNPFLLRDDNAQLIQFGHLEHGLLAGAYRLVEDIRNHRRERTVAQILRRWTTVDFVTYDNLIGQVCEAGYLRPNDVIELSNRNRLARFAWGLAKTLCGVLLPFNYVERAVIIALRPTK